MGWFDRSRTFSAATRRVGHDRWAEFAAFAAVSLAISVKEKASNRGADR
jgi:hypothetical protein